MKNIILQFLKKIKGWSEKLGKRIEFVEKMSIIEERLIRFSRMQRGPTREAILCQWREFYKLIRQAQRDEIFFKDQKAILVRRFQDFEDLVPEFKVFRYYKK